MHRPQLLQPQICDVLGIGNSMGFGDGEKYISFLTDFDGIILLKYLMRQWTSSYLSARIVQEESTIRRKCGAFRFGRRARRKVALWL